MGKSITKFLKINGTSWAYTLSGKGQCLVFLHGWMCNQTFWNNQLNIGKGYQYLTLDFPGHGHSDKLHRSCSIKQVSQDVIRILEKLEINRPVLIGHSMGGMIAQQICLEAKELFDALILVSTIAADTENQLISKRIQVDTNKIGFLASFNQHFEAWFSTKTPKKVRQRVKSQMLLTEEATSLAWVNSYALFDLRDHLKEVPCPTLIIGTQSDNSAPPAQSKELAALIPNSFLTMIDDCGHFPMIEKPNELNRVIKSFVKRLERTYKDE